MENPVLRPAHILLPDKQVDLEKWAVLACDQFTSQPEYWENVAELVGSQPSTRHIILPEVYLEQEDTPQEINKIHKAMKQYRDTVLTQKVEGFVYVERTMQNGAVRQGLIGSVDLEDYSYEKGVPCRIRPSENTVVERIPPRLEVRRGACLESPHILMLADDPQQTILEPLAEKKNQFTPLYDAQLMLKGGRIQGWAITSPQDLQEISNALLVLDDAKRFQQRYNTGAEHSAFALAVGDGNHSLATAKAYWEEIKTQVPQQEWQQHPARFCLVELENIQSPAIEIEPIHRVVFGGKYEEMLAQAVLFCEQNNGTLTPSPSGHRVTALSGEERKDLVFSGLSWPLAVGTLEAFLSFYQQNNPGIKVDYVHDEESVQQLVNRGAIGLLLPPFEKDDLFRGVALGGVLPKKTFSMGHAVEKRYYLECRSIS